MGIKFDKDPSGVEQNNCLTKFLSAYIVYDLDAWSKNPNTNFTLKNFLFGATSIVKNNDKEKWVHSSYGIAFDDEGFLVMTLLGILQLLVLILVHHQE